jgi:hypothetical protein
MIERGGRQGVLAVWFFVGCLLGRIEGLSRGDQLASVLNGLGPGKGAIGEP